MTQQEIQDALTVETGSGSEAPELKVKEIENGFAVYADYYEQNGERGFEPGANFTVKLPDGVTFRGYSGRSGKRSGICL